MPPFQCQCLIQISTQSNTRDRKSKELSHGILSYFVNIKLPLNGRKPENNSLII